MEGSGEPPLDAKSKIDVLYND
ncbi:hypothetical protein TREES_T100004979 [Tupaia chinensis]|uniref:Uncharacterized protein n=1 Tax=Tupaia chinensis TaxID=246437 RepID=L9LD05_TUPCH|nr:hypothetical protein TREES_T100004979 [Tupaia chinensis]